MRWSGSLLAGNVLCCRLKSLGVWKLLVCVSAKAVLGFKRSHVVITTMPKTASLLTSI